MTELPCPQCGAPVAFRSVDLPVRVCGYCRSTVLRDDAGARLMGTAAVVPDDVSPLQIGARGQDGDARFEIVGRVRWRWADGGWNEWLALYDDGSHGWLGEASGRIMLLRPVSANRLSTRLRTRIIRDQALRVGEEVTIDGVAYTVADSRAATVTAAEGELPFAATTGLPAHSVDLMTGDGRCASIQREGDGVELYAGRYVTLAELKPAGLRAFDGWPLPGWAA